MRYDAAMRTQERVVEYLRKKEGQFVSGEQLSRNLGVSRSAIWKAVEKLRDDGYVIQAKTHNGYRFDDRDGRLSGTKLSGLLPNLSVTVLEEVDSTNRLAKEKAASGCPDGTLIVARRQTGGRGRLGRPFSSPHGGIYLSLVLRPRWEMADALLVTSAAAVATAQAIQEETGLSCGIKWVNDLYYQNKKVVGILTEGVMDMENGRLSAVVVGIGINFCTQQQDFPPEFRSIAGSLYAGPSQVPDGVDQNRLVASLASRLLASSHHLSGRAFLEEYRKRCIVIGKDVSVFQGGMLTDQGTATGVDENAHLVLRRGDGSSLVLGTGEISIRLAQSPMNQYHQHGGETNA